MKTAHLTLLLLGCLAGGAVQVFFVSSPERGPAPAVDSLRRGFANPPVAARPKVYWWWLNGYVDTTRAKAELRAMKAAGLGGVDVFEIGLPPASDPKGLVPVGLAFLSPGSLQAIGVALREARRLGLEVGFNLASSWNAGGAWVTPRHAAKTLYVAKIRVSPGQTGGLTLPFPTITPDHLGQPRRIAYAPNGRPAYHEEVAVLALPAGHSAPLDTAQVLNLSRFFDPATERLAWTPPPGEWEIHRYVCANSGEQLIRPSAESAGPIIDHFDSSATRMHLTYCLDRLRPLVGGSFRGSALRYLYLASYEAKEFTWTPGLPAAFRALHGYDLHRLLPALFDKTRFKPALTRGFDADFAHACSELMVHNHYRKAREICRAEGLRIASEAGGPGHNNQHIPVETLKALGSLDIPRGEFWYNRTYFDRDSVDLLWLMKEIAAASHLYRRGVVEEESFTSYWDWQEGPADLKPLADRAFCEGMNRVVIHGFPHNPAGMGHPGIVYFAGTHFNDRQTWWPKIRPFVDYLARISHVLQQTDFVADALYFYGESIPNLVPPKNARFRVGAGYDYELINPETLLRDLRTEGGDLVLPGVGRYRVLCLGNNPEMSEAVLAKLADLAAGGARIVGHAPERAPGLRGQPAASGRIQTGAARLWVRGPLPASGLVRGKIHADVTPLAALTALGVGPDFQFPGQALLPERSAFDFIHYRCDTRDAYLIRNPTAAWVTRPCTLRRGSGLVETWDPLTGETQPVAPTEQTATHTRLSLTLPPRGSVFVVFSGQAPPSGRAAGRGLSAGGLAYTGNPPTPTVLPVGGAWSLRFPPGWGAPASVALPGLASWTESPQPCVRYFSGVGTYEKTISFDAKHLGRAARVFLDLGDVAEVAEVWLNDRPLGVAWTPPYRVEATGALRPGPNRLRVEVANTWTNRLTGDARTGERFTRTNLTLANKNLVPWADLPLRRSGLLGPVQFLVFN